MEADALPVGQDVQVVDPEVRAHVYSLVTALGGFNGEDASVYSLGDDALSCLRDIKKWLKLYDEKTNRMDVARCLGEANLVNGDLIPILSLWWTRGQDKKHLSRIALACLEILVPLTWPVEIHSQMTVNHHRHTPYLQQVQIQYKRGLLNSHGVVGPLRAAIRIGLPSMAIPRSERTSRDEGILKLVLYLLRNVAIIAPSSHLATEEDEEETSRSATINAFHEQDVFALLLTMCSNMGEDFSFQDVIILEILFHLVKGVDVEKLFMNDAERSAQRKDELGDLLQKEKGLKRQYARNAPTRHGRFGTMIWVKRDDKKVSTLSGQDVLTNTRAALNKMDQTKKWNRPKYGQRKEIESFNNNFNKLVPLTPTATKNLRTFVEEFLDSGFNPLMTHVRKAIEREAERVLDIHTRQFLYVVAWFLRAERVRRRRQYEQRAQCNGRQIEPDSFALVASVLNQETFVFLNRTMQRSLDNKDWHDLTANMRCFTQILLTVQEMAHSPFEEDREIADNIQNRIFYEETTHDRIVSILRGYKDQGFGYLDACTELSHVFIRMLERYSKENVDMQVRSRRRARARKKKREITSDADKNDEDEEMDSEAEEFVDATIVSRERKFDFSRFIAKFCNQKCVDTFVLFTQFYQDLDSEQLKRAHRFFYRIAFKQDMSTLLFRVDIMDLFYRMIKGPNPLDSSNPMYREWEEFVKYLTRKMIKKIEQRPVLVTEMLFSKINATLFYLEYGHEKQTVQSSTKPAAELEVHPRAGTTKEEKLNVVVSALAMDGYDGLVRWLMGVLESAATERSSWEVADEARRSEAPDAHIAPNPIIEVKPSDESIKTAMYRNGKLRLLMSLIGLERLGTEDILGASWIVPSSLSASELRDIRNILQKGIENPATEIEGLDPRKQLRRKKITDRQDTYQTSFDGMNGVDFGSDSEGEDQVPDGPLFPPNPRSRSNALQELKNKRRKRRQRNEDQETVDDTDLEERRRKREEAARARAAKIKSDLYIHASDEETDEERDKEFFAREEALRKAQSSEIRAALVSKALAEEEAERSQRNKAAQRRRNQDSSGEDEEDDDSDNYPHKRQRFRVADANTDSEDDDLIIDSVDRKGHSSQLNASASEDTAAIEEDGAFARISSAESEETIDEEKGNSDPVDTASDDDAQARAPRRRMRAGFVIDSDSE